MISRRKFIKALIAGAMLSPFGDIFASKGSHASIVQKDAMKEGNNLCRSPSSALVEERNSLREKRLKMYNVHTDEYLDIHYCTSGIYDREAHDEINYFLRCHYTNEVADIDTGLLDLLCDIKDCVDRDKEIRIISGYRSSRYNELLIRQGRNVSRSSLHLQGLAIDFAMKGTNNRKLSHLARTFGAGGVGTYREFVHIDVGRVRFW